MLVEKRPEQELEQRRRRGRHHGYDPDDFFGLEVEKMNPRAQVWVAVTVLALVTAGAALVLTLVPWLFWLIFVFGWMVFPAFGLLVKGIAGLSEERTELSSANGKERELLQALQREGELTPAWAAGSSMPFGSPRALRGSLKTEGKGLWVGSRVVSFPSQGVGKARSSRSVGQPERYGREKDPEDARRGLSVT